MFPSGLPMRFKRSQCKDPALMDDPETLTQLLCLALDVRGKDAHLPLIQKLVDHILHL